MSNPILNSNRFSAESVVLEGEPMTIGGTVNKIFMLFACLGAGVLISLFYLFSGNPAIVPILMSIGAILSFILVIATCFDIKRAKYTAAPYAFFQGLFIGGLSAMFEAKYQGIVIQAILISFVVLFVMLTLYKARMIRYTQKFAAVLTTGLLSIFAVYAIEFIAAFFGREIPLIFGSGLVGIGFSLIVVIFAAASFIQDFFFIEEASNKMLSKDYEWFGAMGLMITFIWLYVEILKLLTKFNSRR